jgi:uncharacterized membrane protein
MRKTIAKAVTWRLIGTAEIFAISFWTTGHIATAGHTAGIAAITSVLMYVAHELAWDRHEVGGLIPTRGSQRPQADLKVFASNDASNAWFAEHDPEGVAFEYEVLK